MARNEHLWVYTPHVSEVMITLGVTNVSDLQEFIFVEDLVDKGINKVTACKILQLVGDVRYRPGGPEKAVPSDASVRVQQSSGNKGTGRAAVRTLTQVREAETPVQKPCREAPIGSFLIRSGTVMVGRLRRGLRCAYRSYGWWELECRR